MLTGAMADHTTGALCAGGIAAALLQTRATGKGQVRNLQSPTERLSDGHDLQVVDASLLRTALYINSWANQFALSLGGAPLPSSPTPAPLSLAHETRRRSRNLCKRNLLRNCLFVLSVLAVGWSGAANPSEAVRSMRPYTARRPYWGQGPVSCAASAALSNPTFRLAFAAVFMTMFVRVGFLVQRLLPHLGRQTVLLHSAGGE